MNLDYVRTRRFEATEQTYDWRDAALYAVALGMGSDPLDEDELVYVYEGRQQQVAPSMSVTLGWPPFWHAEPAAGIDWAKVLHGEQQFELHRPLPLEASIRAEHKIRSVADKGRERGALIAFETEVSDARTGEQLVSLRSTQFLRGDGGCGDYGTPPPAPPAFAPTGEPIASLDYRTPTQAALLYRLASRDYMPIHADPEIARRAGFERPISHGLNTMGLACRAVLKRFAPRRAERLRAMAVRFVSPAFPGETIRIEMFADGETIRFRAWALERQTLVLDRGECRLADRAA